MLIAFLNMLKKKDIFIKVGLFSDSCIIFFSHDEIIYCFHLLQVLNFSNLNGWLTLPLTLTVATDSENSQTRTMNSRYLQGLTDLSWQPS